MRDPLGGDGLVTVTAALPILDEAYEFRTDNPTEAMPLISGCLGLALDWLLEAWPGEPARIALSDHDGFLLLPVVGKKNFFELPDIAVPLDYSAHIAPMISEMGKLLAIGNLIRRAVER